MVDIIRRFRIIVLPPLSKPSKNPAMNKRHFYPKTWVDFYRTKRAYDPESSDLILSGAALLNNI
jgi:hypothetical protein